MLRNACVRFRAALLVLGAVSSLGLDGRGGASLGAPAEARSCQGGDFCVGACPVKLAWPWDGAWCAGGARHAGGESYHKEGRCGHVGRGDFLGAYVCLFANAAIPIAGCNVSVADIPSGVRCLWSKAEAELKAKLRINVLGCDLSVADPAGSFQCLKDKAIEEFKKGVGGLLALIEQARPVIECAGLGDLIRFGEDFFKNPGAAIQSAFDKVKTFVDGIAGKIANNGMALGAQLLSLVSGTSLAGNALDQVMAFLWSTGEEMAAFSGPMRCLMNVLKKHKATIEPVARGVVGGLIGGVPSVVNMAAGLLGEKAGTAILDKVMKAILGEARAARLKDYVAKNLRNDMEDHAASLLGSVLDAIRNKSPNLKKLWLDARAAIHGTDGDFGVRRLFTTLSAVIEQLAGFAVDELALELTKWLIRGLDTGLVNIGNRVIEGLCGLIPEVGAAICTATVVLAVRTAWNTVVQFLVDKTLTPILQKALAFLPSLVAKQVSRLVADRLSGLAVKGIDGAVATNPGAGWASRAVSPFVNCFIKIVESTFLPGLKRSLAYTSKLAELGDMAVAMALKENLPARQAPPVVALSGSIPRLPEQGVELPAVAGPGASAGGGKRGVKSAGATGTQRLGAWRGPFANQLIHCGVPGTPKYATLAGCRIKSGPGCVADGGGQCSFPRAEARSRCEAHGSCAGFTCAKGAATCQARDAAEARYPVANASYDSEVHYGMSEHMGGQLIHCGVAGTPTYGTVAGCRIKDGPGCTGAVPGQCSFPIAQAMTMCMQHPRCRGITCNTGRADCQARDADEAKTLVAHGSFGSRVALAFAERDNAIIHCGAKGKPGHATLAGCRIKSGPGCVADGTGQCSFPRARAEALCRAHPQCRGFTCGKGAATCQARDGDEVRHSVETNPSFSSSVGQ